MTEPRDRSAALAQGAIVRSTAGRDRGALYVVVGHEGDRYVLVADGRARPVRRPKKKNARHLVATGHDPGLARALAAGRSPGDAELREALAASAARAEDA